MHNQYVVKTLHKTTHKLGCCYVSLHTLGCRHVWLCVSSDYHVSKYCIGMNVHYYMHRHITTVHYIHWASFYIIWHVGSNMCFGVPINHCTWCCIGIPHIVVYQLVPMHRGVPLDCAQWDVWWYAHRHTSLHSKLTIARDITKHRYIYGGVQWYPITSLLVRKVTILCCYMQWYVMKTSHIGISLKISTCNGMCQYAEWCLVISRCIECTRSICNL